MFIWELLDIDIFYLPTQSSGTVAREQHNSRSNLHLNEWKSRSC